MKLTSVNVARAREAEWNGRTFRTAIFKEPVAGRIRVGRLGLEGDEQADSKFHGGPDQAVYAFPVEHASHWSCELGRELGPGHFGENLTVTGLAETRVHVGDVLGIGSARFQVTLPRVPCNKIAMRMGDDTFPKRFLRSLKTGFYFRVLQEGDVGAGDAIELVSEDPIGLSLARLTELYFFDADPADLRRALSIESLAKSARPELEKRLRDAEAAG